MANKKIPVIDARGRTPAWSATQAHVEMSGLMMAAENFYSKPGLILGDKISRHWLRKNANPYLSEMEETSYTLQKPGVYALNTSYEWACTSGSCPDGQGGQKMIRVLDWRMDGLGENLCAIYRSGPAGDWLDIGWPGSSGTVTAVAKGRFAAAINQPPLPSTKASQYISRHSTNLAIAMDWTLSRKNAWNSCGLSPVQLLRKVFDEARDWREAVDMLCSVPISTPVFFVVAGTNEGDGCIVERFGRDFAIVRPDDFCNPSCRQNSVAVANHWQKLRNDGIPRGHDSSERLSMMSNALSADNEEGWLRTPIINRNTRVVVTANPRTGAVSAQGWEKNGPATEKLILEI